MPFSREVKDAALVACARHCCICHKFCGIKMECHHIVHEEAGGDDTESNCMPLCFDCHSDMRSYDFKHPKGNKYTEEELRQHRDAWYSQVEATGTLLVSAAHCELDIVVYRNLLTEIPYFPTLAYLKERNFAGFSYERAAFDHFGSYVYHADMPDKVFLDAVIEGARASLVAALRAFNKTISLNTFPTHQDGFNTVPPEWEDEQPERFYQVVDEIHTAANEVERTYREFYRVGRERLGVHVSLEPAGV